MARWRIHQLSFIDTGNNGGGALFDAGSEISVGPLRAAVGSPGDPGYRPAVVHRPGPHWEPLDDEAKAIAADTKTTFTGEVPDVVNALADELESSKAAMDAANRATPVTAEMIAAIVAEALKQHKPADQVPAPAAPVPMPLTAGEIAAIVSESIRQTMETRDGVAAMKAAEAVALAGQSAETDVGTEAKPKSK
jgi:hypothetical protein